MARGMQRCLHTLHRLQRVRAGDEMEETMKRLMLMLQCWFAVVATGCAAAYYDPYYYDYTYYDPYYSYYDAYYAYTWVDPWYDTYYFAVTPGTSAAVDLNDAASRIAAGAATYYTPGGCAVSTASGATVTTTFNACEGVGGKISGTTVLTLAQNQGQTGFSATSSGLTINGEPFNLDLQGTITSTSSQRVVKLTSKSHSPQRLDSRQAESTLTWDKGTSCLSVNGTSSSSRGGQSATATLSDFRRCVGQCPTSGTMTVQAPSGTFSTTFDGSEQVRVNGPDGSTRDLTLTCR
jgi:hypothetical protein